MFKDKNGLNTRIDIMFKDKNGLNTLELMLC